MNITIAVSHDAQEQIEDENEEEQKSIVYELFVSTAVVASILFVVVFRIKEKYLRDWNPEIEAIFLQDQSAVQVLIQNNLTVYFITGERVLNTWSAEEF